MTAVKLLPLNTTHCLSGAASSDCVPPPARLERPQFPEFCERSRAAWPRNSSTTWMACRRPIPAARNALRTSACSSLPGVKIGVVGVNGAGKSTLLRIMAGLDKDFTGEAWAAEGRARRLSAAGTAARREHDRARERHAGRRRQEGQARPLQRTRDELFRRDRRRDGNAAGRDRRENLWDLDSQIDIAMEALRCPPDDAASTTLSGGERAASRSASCCSKRPKCCCWTSRPTISTPKPSPGCKSTCIDYKGTILIVTHDRYFLDDITGWILELDRGRGIPYEGNYSAWMEQKAKRLRQEAREDKSQEDARWTASWNGCAPRPSAAGQVQGPHQRL